MATASMACVAPNALVRTSLDTIKAPHGRCSNPAQTGQGLEAMRYIALMAGAAPVWSRTIQEGCSWDQKDEPSDAT